MSITFQDKVAKLSIDNVPTSGSENAISSGGVFDALRKYEPLATSTGTTYADHMESLIEAYESLSPEERRNSVLIRGGLLFRNFGAAHYSCVAYNVTNSAPLIMTCHVINKKVSQVNFNDTGAVRTILDEQTNGNAFTLAKLI